MSAQAKDKYQSFNDLNGNPLDSGYVYIGVSGSNPETTPVSIYSDSDLTVPVAQPLRTIGGYIVVNGSPVNIYTSADYSITVRGSDSSLIYTSLYDNIDASQVAGTQLPPISIAEAGKILIVNAAGDGYDLSTIPSKAVDVTSSQTIAGIKTFSSFPVTPSSAPLSDYQIANKKYVDDSVFGAGQVWTDVFSSRVSGSTYTNSTSKPITVSVLGAITASAVTIQIHIDSVLVYNSYDASTTNKVCNATGIIPAGSDYKVTFIGTTIDSWKEFR